MERFRRLRARQVEGATAELRTASRALPAGGWVRAVRESLGMSLSQLAERLGVAAQSVHALERREVAGSVTLDALRKAADALDADLVYAVVPRRPIPELLRRQAERVAEVTVGRVAHSMALEDQVVTEQERRRQVQELADEFMRKPPRSLWRRR